MRPNIAFMLQLIRYGCVGVLSNLLLYFGYLFITYIGTEPKHAMTILYIIGALIGYVSNRRWTFAYRGDSAQAVARYILAYMIGYILNYIILFAFVDQLGCPHQIVQGLAIVIVGGGLFVVLKYYVFHEKSYQ